MARRRKKEHVKYTHAVSGAAAPRVSARERRKKRRQAEKVRERQMQQPAVRPRPQWWQFAPRLRFGWRLVSLVMILALSGALYVLFNENMFYVSHVYVGGLRYLSPEEVYRLTNIADQHIFWVNPEDVARAVERDAAIAAAEVEAKLPGRVHIYVVEREPSIVWEQAGVRSWVDVQGYVMPLRDDLPELLRIVVEGEDEPVTPYSRIDPDVVAGALQLRALRPNIERLFLHPIEGLGLLDGRGWRVYFGTGTDMEQKLLVYEALVDEMWQEGSDVHFDLFDVGDLQAPYFR
jgi:cell division septal protein FtsQ